MLDTNDALSERSRGRRKHGSRAGAETEEEEQSASRDARSAAERQQRGHGLAGAGNHLHDLHGSPHGSAHGSAAGDRRHGLARHARQPCAICASTCTTAARTEARQPLRSAYGSWSSPRGRAAGKQGRTDGKRRPDAQQAACSISSSPPRLLRAIHALRGLDDRSSAGIAVLLPGKQFCTLRDCRTRGRKSFDFQWFLAYR